jgi:YVTN family beta-propeller protein
MYIARNSWLILFGILSILGFACKKMIDPAFTNTHYPADIEEIFVNKCATAGCHNEKSYQNAANLNMSSWETLLQGGVSGSVVIPYSVNQSSLLQFINTYDDLGIRSSPTMPINGQPLSREEVTRVKTWIAEGCPSREGEIPFASNPTTRAKAYITNQGCDLVSVVDAETRLVMRYVSVGHDPNQIELPHRIAVSPDGKYWYVCFTNGSYVQKFDAHYDTLVSEVFIGPAMWNVIVTSYDGKKAFVSDLSSNGKLVEIDLMTMAVTKTLQGSGLFTFPHGLAYSQTHDTIYATAQYGNMIYRIIPSVPQVDKISLVKGALPVTTPQLQDPHEVLMSPDFSQYFVTCQSSNELRVMRRQRHWASRLGPASLTPASLVLTPYSCSQARSTQQSVCSSATISRLVISTSSRSTKHLHPWFLHGPRLLVPTSSAPTQTVEPSHWVTLSAQQAPSSSPRH